MTEKSEMSWTITMEVTVSGDIYSAEEAAEVGEGMLDYLVSGYDGAAGAVVLVASND